MIHFNLSYFAKFLISYKSVATSESPGRYLSGDSIHPLLLLKRAGTTIWTDLAVTSAVRITCDTFF